MAAQLREAFAILCMGRSRRAVLAEVAAIVAVTPALWFAACIVAAMGPMQ